jgi:2-methylcitrate dehydratase PrpD
MSGQIFKSLWTSGGPDMTLSQLDGGTASEALAALLDRPIPEDTRKAAALHLIDWLGCALAGAATDTGRAMSQVAGGHPFTRAGTGGEAATALGGLGSLLEMDDVHRGALLHPGPVVAAVVMAAPRGDALAALVAGYEAMIRLGRSVGPGHYARFHNTATCGGIGAAGAAARMDGLSRAQTVSAIGHAMSLAGGLWQCRNEPVATKHLHVAEAARRGVAAARYAAAGLAGPRFILEGPQGFFAGLAPDGDIAQVTVPGDGWLIHDVSFKPWPACRHTHPAIDAALALRAQLGGRTPRAVHVQGYADAILFCDKPAPADPDAARFSLQHAVAVALQDGAPALAAFETAALPAYAALRARITVAADPDLTAAYPAHFGARVTVQTDDGPLTAHVADAWGDTENPMDTDAILTKYRRLTDSANVPADLALALADAALALPTGGPLSALHQLMHRIADLPSTRSNAHA